ncbi:MAG: hypothetical protein WC107_03440 [Patescibacteria group bacterium]
MNSNTKTFLSIVIVVIVIAGGLIYAAGKNSAKTENNDDSEIEITNNDQQYDDAYVEKLAKFLNSEGMVMYGAYWCSHCNSQKKMFGDAAKYLDYVECDPKGQNANPDECTAQGIDGYPTWVYKGQKYSGERKMSELAEIVGFTDRSDAESDAEINTNTNDNTNATTPEN